MPRERRAAPHLSAELTNGSHVTQFILAYDGRPSYSLSILEFQDGKVARETQYFADPFELGSSRAQWVERMG